MLVSHDVGRVSPARGATAWLAPAVVAAWLLAAGFAEGGARYGVPSAAFVGSLYALLAGALHFGALWLARRSRLAGLAAALAVGSVLAWQLREQTAVPHSRALFAAAALGTGLAYHALLRRAAALRGPVHAGWLALATAALFAVHPVHTEAVYGIVGRAELLSAFLVFSCLLVSWRVVRDDPEGWGRPALAGFLLWLAALSKEYAIVVPLIPWC